MFGLFLVIVGVFFLLKNMGIIAGDFWGYLWPLLIIFLGLSIADKSKKKKGDGGCWCWLCGSKDKNKNKGHKVVDEQ
ncbi:MAG: DUF5668 domain-containing protein [Patescibacteria group bacterium]|nr:DUF5668 domain-containing protein [Patescibacteria group bacterium]